MLFVSPYFLFIFLPVVFGLHFIIEKRFKNIWLAIASFFFYAWGGLGHALIILFSSIANYIFGLKVDPLKEKSHKVRKLWFVLSITFNVGILAYFKYFNFLVENVTNIIRLVNSNFTIEVPEVALPIGISFFTFQIMSYVIDVYRGHVSVQRNYINLALYIMLFPQLIAGPIVRYIDVEKQITNRTVNMSHLSEGIERFIIGFSKKMLIANSTGLVADTVFNNVNIISTQDAWIGILCYSLQIYFDFSAYSDMAIGLGKMFGFDFLENFNYPYISTSVQEFWRRWHISLSTWFRDYLYIPLGGSRGSLKRTYLNLGIVFFVTGLWHGSSWNFVIWGLWHGMFLIFERIGLSNLLKRMPMAVRWIYTMLVAMVGWVFFRAPSLDFAMAYIKKMFILNSSSAYVFSQIVDSEALFYTVIGIICSVPVYQLYKKNEVFPKWQASRIVHNITLLIIFGVSIMYMTGSSFNPFIYFIF